MTRRSNKDTLVLGIGAEFCLPSGRQFMAPSFLGSQYSTEWIPLLIDTKDDHSLYCYKLPTDPILSWELCQYISVMVFNPRSLFSHAAITGYVPSTIAWHESRDEILAPLRLTSSGSVGATVITMWIIRIFPFMLCVCFLNQPHYFSLRGYVALF